MIIGACECCMTTIKMDENEFFHQATLRICGNLEIEKSLASCLLSQPKTLRELPEKRNE